MSTATAEVAIARPPPSPTTAPPTTARSRPRRQPFDRATHCWAIAAGGGQGTVERYGAQHMRTIGKAGARATIARHGVGHRRGIVQAKGWASPRTPDLAADLALGGPGRPRCLARLGRVRKLGDVLRFLEWR